jgi:hypothetical protein
MFLVQILIKKITSNQFFYIVFLNRFNVVIPKINFKKQHPPNYPTTLNAAQVNMDFA